MPDAASATATVLVPGWTPTEASDTHWHCDSFPLTHPSSEVVSTAFPRRGSLLLGNPLNSSPQLAGPEDSWRRNERLVQGAMWRPSVRAGGDGASLINPGVLVTCVRTPFQHAVGLRCCVRISVPYAPFVWGPGMEARRTFGLVGAHMEPYTAGRTVATCDNMGWRRGRALRGVLLRVVLGTLLAPLRRWGGELERGVVWAVLVVWVGVSALRLWAEWLGHDDGRRAIRGCRACVHPWHIVVPASIRALATSVVVVPASILGTSLVATTSHAGSRGF
jgi:hypothetical protein